MTYALCPGYVVSKHDGQLHFIGAYQLAWLYRLKIEQCFIADTPEKEKYATKKHMTLLRPNYKGSYDLPEKDSNTSTPT
jgi:hypothetical protein